MPITTTVNVVEYTIKGDAAVTTTYPENAQSAVLAAIPTTLKDIASAVALDISPVKDKPGTWLIKWSLSGTRECPQTDKDKAISEVADIIRKSLLPTPYEVDYKVKTYNIIEDTSVTTTSKVVDNVETAETTTKRTKKRVEKI